MAIRTPDGDSAPGRRSVARRLAASLLVLTVVYSLFVGTLPISRAAGAQEALALPDLPDVSAKAVLARDVSAGVDLYALNPDEPLPPASTTKIATALVVLEHAELDELVVIEPADLVDIDVYSHMGESGLFVGDTFTVEQLLWGALLPSGSDAAKALARHVGSKLNGGDATVEGPIDAFVAEMNSYAEGLGLENSHFANPDGADADGHLSSARDLTTLAAELLKNETLREMVGTAAFDVVSVGPEQRIYHLVNTNDLLGEGGVIGVKTGTEEQAGGCLVIGARRERNRVVVVVLGSTPPVYDPITGEKLEDQRFDDARAILEQMDEDYTWVTASDEGTVPGLDEALAAWGVAVKRGPSLVVPADSADELTFRLRLGPPGEPEAEVGRVLFFAGSVMVGERVLIQAPAASAGAESEATAAA